MAIFGYLVISCGRAAIGMPAPRYSRSGGRKRASDGRVKWLAPQRSFLLRPSRLTWQFLSLLSKFTPPSSPPLPRLSCSAAVVVAGVWNPPLTSTPRLKTLPPPPPGPSSLSPPSSSLRAARRRRNQAESLR